MYLLNKMKKYTVYLLVLGMISCFDHSLSKNKELTEEDIDHKLNQWHLAAANANLEAYMGFMDSTCVYLGTDATEYWTKKEFESFCTPYFERGQTWEFVAVERNVYLSKDQEVAWFDEVLNGHMGLCRGSGALIKRGSEWKLTQYVLSVLVPNEKMGEIIEIKSDWDHNYILEHRK